MNKYIDQTLLKADITSKQLEEFIEDAIANNFASVCVNPVNVELASNQIKKSKIENDLMVCTTIGFPLGQNTVSVKAFEAKQAIQNGAHEIDMVLNVSKVKDQNYEYIKNEVKAVKKSCGNFTLKVILEICYLTDEEIFKASEAAIAGGANFLKTSTGFGTGGATENAIKIMKKAIGENKNVFLKASGGIRTIEQFNDYIKLGVTRIGTSNGSLLIKGQKINKGDY